MSKRGSKARSGGNNLTQFNKNEKAEDIRMTNIAAAKCKTLITANPIFKLFLKNSARRCGSNQSRSKRYGQDDSGWKRPCHHHQ